MTNQYTNVGDVRRTVNEVLKRENTHTRGGSFYPHMQAVIFGVHTTIGDYVGDVHCPLPNGGWLTRCYGPEQNNPADVLHLRTLHGIGKLILPFKGEYDLDANLAQNHFLQIDSSGMASYQIINPGRQLLIIRANSIMYHSNPTDINRPGLNEIDDSMQLASDRVVTFEETHNPNGTVGLYMQGE